MNRLFMPALAPMLLFGAIHATAQPANDRLTPTIPETQIQPAELSSPYEFLSVSTSADQFVIDAAAVAATNAESASVKSLAQDLSTAHKQTMAASQDAGKLDKVDIAQPAPDGEQKGLVGKLQGLKGADFDRAYVESQLFGHQRMIAYYRGYADETDNLGKYANATLPQLISQYGMLLAEAGTLGLDKTEAKPAAN